MIYKTLFLKLAVMICVITIALPAQAKWSFVRKISIKNTGKLLTDAVIPVELNSGNFDYTKAGANGADIRFFSNSNLSGDGLPYWIEQWNQNGASIIWVKVPQLVDGKSQLYLFYGNAEAKPASNGNDTFLFFDDFEDGDFSKKWNNVSIGQVEERDGMLKLKESDGQVGQINANYDINDKVIIRTAYQRERADEHWTASGIGGWGRWFCYGDHTEVAGQGTNYLMFYDGKSMNNIDAKPIVKSPIAGINDKWRKAEFWYDGKSIFGKMENVTISWSETPLLNFSSKLALRTLDNDSWDNYAYITVSHYINTTLIDTKVGAERKN